MIGCEKMNGIITEYRIDFTKFNVGDVFQFGGISGSIINIEDLTCDENNKCFIEKCANINSFESILHKIDVVSYGYEMINCNLNVNLLLDDIVIRLGDVHEYS